MTTAQDSNMPRPFTDLEVWKEGRILAKMIYELSQNFPAEEAFGLKSQIRRAAVSVISNLAEGCGRNYPKDSIQLFHIARGSLYELESQCFISFDLSYFNDHDLESAIKQIGTCKRLLNGFIRYYSGFLNESKSKNYDR